MSRVSVYVPLTFEGPAAVAFANLAELLRLLESLSVSFSLADISIQVDPEVSGALLDRPIEELGFSDRPYNCLKRAQVHTLGELLLKSPKDLLAIINFGHKSVEEVVAKLDEMGLSLRAD